MWKLAEFGENSPPFQIHTGHARIQGSNPMNLLNLIEAMPKTKFILFHGGYPWIGETGAIMQRHGRHVWIGPRSGCRRSATPWGSRAYQEWLEVMPSNWIRAPTPIMWKASMALLRRPANAWPRRWLKKGRAAGIREVDARRIGTQILRENALELFPQLRSRLWKGWKDTSATGDKGG